MAKKATIVDVATGAGVSPSTVSHVLSGKRPISEAVCNRVKAVISDLGYKPNQAAVNLVSKKTMQIGVLVDEVDNSVTGSLIEKISECLLENRYTLLLGICGYDHKVATDYVGKFCSGMVDGIINMVGGLSSKKLYKLCDGIPNISYMRNDGSPVSFDKLGGAVLVMEHLWGLGHRRIGYLSSPSENSEIPEDRELGYRQFLVRMGCEIEESLIMSGDDTIQSGVEFGQQLYELGATAIFAANDMMAVGVLQWAYEHGLKIPQNLSVVGFDDAPIAKAVVPPLTTVQMPVAQLASKTVDGLMKIINGKNYGQTEILSAKLMVRKSTALVSGDRDV